MPKFEYRFDIAAILLASTLTAVGMSAAQAGEKPDAGISGGSGGRSAAATASSASGAGSSGSTGAGSVILTGGKAGGVVGSHLRFGR